MPQARHPLVVYPRHPLVVYPGLFLVVHPRQPLVVYPGLPLLVYPRHLPAVRGGQAPCSGGACCPYHWGTD